MSLKVLTWNMAWGYGLGSEGTANYRKKSAESFKTALQNLAEVILCSQADVVFLQEVDFHSSRSHGVDQLGALARLSGLLYHQGLVTWNHPFIPYPGMNPFQQFGMMKSGGGILSRFPIENIQADLLPKPRENGKLYNHFYLSRFLQMVEIRGYRLCNLHLEAFSESNRELHLIKLEDRMLDYDLDLAGGDFNGLIRTSDEGKDKWEVYQGNEATFPSHSPSQFLDGFLVKKKRFAKVEIETLNTGTISDHFPVLITLTS